jgi:hypothetical protein
MTTQPPALWRPEAGHTLGVGAGFGAGAGLGAGFGVGAGFTLPKAGARLECEAPATTAVQSEQRASRKTTQRLVTRSVRRDLRNHRFGCW